MKKLLLALAVAACARQAPPSPDMARWEQRAGNVSITRDDWGIAHIHGRSDPDAVFGLIYAQAEDDFNRVEVNYLTVQGRLAEAEGEAAIYSDLRMKMFVNPDSLKALYAASPEWLRALMDAWADGLNYYLAKHPEVKPRVLTHFEPWMALSFTEGSIGRDEETISLEQLAAFYGGKGAAKRVAVVEDRRPRAPTGSNGIAIGPSNTAEGKALLLINPHTSFFFRSEVQVSSDEGLNAYGAVTWGQFFVYQGFNEHAGWMHTSSGADAVDEFAEVIVRRGDSLFYRYGTELRAVRAERVVVPFKGAAGLETREFTVYRTHHGPVVRAAGDRWISVALMNEPIKALTQSFSRTKANNYREFRATMELHTNSSNNTIFADHEGNIAYFHANHVPRRDPRFDYQRPVDGSAPATEWKGLHGIDDSPHLLNPPNGWLYNTNNWPYSAAGPNSPKQRDYPAYMERYRENPRGIHAVRVLQGRKDFTIASLIEAAYDSYLPAFADLLPPLVRAWDALPAASPVKARLAGEVQVLREWDYRWGVSSVATALAVYWGQEMLRRASADPGLQRLSFTDFVATRTSAAQRLDALAAASDTLAADFGTWKTPWGEINRFQRLTDDIVHPFRDDAPSIPVGFTSADWGSLAAFEARTRPGTKKMYGTDGNSFVAVVQFGDSVRARAVTAGGESGDPASKHFNDQAERYATGNLREVYFYPSQLKAHTERSYHPGQ